MIIGTGKNSGLGDVLLLTPICHEFPNSVVQLCPKAEKFSVLFRGICNKVDIVENPVDLVNVGNDHFARAKLCGLGCPNASCIPKIHLDDNEIIEASKLVNTIHNPIVIITNCSPHWKKVREINRDKWLKLLPILCKDFTPIQFGQSNNIMSLPNVKQMLDLPIIKLAALYKVIGRYIGIDTGDRHLMLAVGGRCINIVPPSCPEYEHHRWHYAEKYWTNEKCRSKYVLFSEINKIDVAFLKNNLWPTPQ